MEVKLKPIGAQAVVVFGASSGIGRIAALEFARKGAKVLVAARGEEGLKSLVEEIREMGGEAFYVVADAANFEQVKAVADKAVELFGRIDTWVHSAAALIFARFEQTEPEEFQRLIEVNLLGQIYGAKAALPHLKKHGGALIHLSSVESYRTVPFQSAYGASKHGINGFLKALRVELEHDEIPVSVTQILPHAINTPVYDKARNKMPFKARPIPPIYHPQIVADAILYAAENPIAELVAGGAGAVAVMTERVSPAFSEWFTKKVGFSAQTTDEENPGVYDGNLFEPVSGMDTVEGSFSDEQIESDPYTYVKTHPKVKTGLFAAGGIIGGLLAWRMLRRK
jgi:NAD(P)-dependent dehydrogenase (short-subunit alcohol dehydrogenase family)